MSTRKVAYIMFTSLIVVSLFLNVCAWLIAHPGTVYALVVICALVVIPGWLWAMAYVLLDILYEMVWTRQMWEDEGQKRGGSGQ